MEEDNSHPAVESHSDESVDRGRGARRPWQIPVVGWKDVVWRVVQEVERDEVLDIAAGVAFYGLLAIFPALIATVSIYGIILDPSAVVAQVDRLTLAMPQTARSIVIDQLNEISSGPQLGLRLGLAGSLAVALFSASGGVAALMRGINKAYDEEETRGWLRTRLMALGLTLGFASFFVVSVATITLLPSVLEVVGLAAPARDLIQIARWPALSLATMLGLGVLYRYAPNRTPPKWQWVTIGAVFATVIWTVASLSLGAYVENFGRYNRIYGTLGGAIVLSLWVYLSALAILLGAELNSELEHQTAQDSTVGPPKPMGERGASAADELGKARPERSRREPEQGVATRVRQTLSDWNRRGRNKRSMSK